MKDFSMGAGDTPSARRPPAPEATASGRLPAGQSEAATRERWDDDMKMAWSTLEPAALCLVATDGPVSVVAWGPDGEARRFGHNRGVWPAKIAKTGAWRDTVTTTYDKNPFFFLGTVFRLWCRTAEARDRLAAAVVDLIAARSEADGGTEALGHGFQDLGPDLDLALFEMEIRAIAERQGAEVWDDIEMRDHLERVVRRARQMAGATVLRMRTIEAAAEVELRSRRLRPGFSGVGDSPAGSRPPARDGGA